MSTLLRAHTRCTGGWCGDWSFLCQPLQLPPLGFIPLPLQRFLLQFLLCLLPRVFALLPLCFPNGPLAFFFLAPDQSQCP
jgi:hypothetical protein